MIFIFLLILFCYVDHTAKYLLKSADVTQIIVGLTPNFDSFLSNVHKRFFFIFSTFLRFTVLFLYERLLHLWFTVVKLFLLSVGLTVATCSRSKHVMI